MMVKEAFEGQQRQPRRLLDRGEQQWVSFLQATICRRSVQPGRMVQLESWTIWIDW